MSDEGIQDASLQAATQKLMGMLGEKGMDAFEERFPDRPNELARDVTRKENSGDLDADVELTAEEEAEMRARSAQNDKTKPIGKDDKAAAEDGAEGNKAEAEEPNEDFLEIPPEAEGDEAIKVTLAEAADAVKQVRAWNGDRQAALIRIEDEGRAKNAQAYAEAMKALQETREFSQLALRALPLPQQPSREYLNPQSPYYNPEYYHTQKIAYDDALAMISKVRADDDRAAAEQQKLAEKAAQEHIDIENRRVSQYFPEWKQEATREQFRQELTRDLGRYYPGITPELMANLPFHHDLIRLAKDAIAHRAAPAKAAEVKKAVQEKIPRITRGQAQPARDGQGRFAASEGTKAKEALRASGSEADAARAFLTDPALRKAIGL